MEIASNLNKTCELRYSPNKYIKKKTYRFWLWLCKTL